MTDLIEKVEDVIERNVAVYREYDEAVIGDAKDAAKAAIETVLREMMEPNEYMLAASELYWRDAESSWQDMLRTFAQSHNIQLGGEDGEVSL